MAYMINALCGIARAAYEVADVVGDTRKVCTENQGCFSLLSRVARIGLRITGLTNFGCEIKAQYEGAPVSTLHSLKEAECFLRSADKVVSASTALCNLSNGKIDAFEFIDQGFIAPMVSSMRARNELEIYQQKQFLEMSPEERAKHVHKNGSNSEAPGKPITESECREVLTECEKYDTFLKAAEVVSKIGIVQTTENILTARNLVIDCAALTASLTAARIDNTVLTANLAAAGVALQNAINNANTVLEDVDPFDLRALPTIPAELHNDVILQRFVCPITGQPIRFPVADPTAENSEGNSMLGQLFERSAIEEALRRKPQSPITRRPLQIHELEERPALQALIDSRLDLHAMRMRQAVAANLQRPAHLALLRDAQDENPNLELR